MSPFDAVWRLLKGPEDFDKIQDDLERSKTEGRRSFPEGRRKKRSMGSGSTEEEHEPRKRPNARNRAPSLEATEAFYDSLELHPGSRGHEINTLRNEAGPRSHPPQFGTFMPLDTKEYIFEEDAENILPQEPPLGPDDRMRDVALQRETLSEVPTFAQTPFNPLTGFTRSEPMDLAWRLLKEDPLDPEERTPVDDEKIQYKFPSAGPYWTLNDRQKKVADAALDLPSEYLSEEGWSGYDFNHLFADGHETVPDHEYDRLESALRHFKTYIKDHMADPDSDKSPQFLESWDDPRHPWAMARNMAYRETEPYDGFSEKIQDLNKSEPVDLAWQILKEFYIDDNDDSRGFFTTPGEDSEDALTHFRNIRSPYTRGGSFPRLQPDGSFVGARVGRDTDDSDESMQDLADTLAHEHVHNLIEGEMEDFATEKFGSPQLLAPVFGEPQPREQPSGRRRNRFQKRPILNQSEIDADKERLALREQAKTYAHEYGAHQADQSSQPGVNSYLAERSDTGDMYSQIRTDQFGYYPSMQEQQQVASMMPPPIQQPDTIQAGEPMDLAWRLLKSQMTRPTRKKLPGTLDREIREKIDRLIEEERGMSLEEWRNKVLDEAYNRNFAFRAGGQSRLPGYIEHFATSNRQLGKPEIPKSALMPAIGDATRDVEQSRIADAAPARPQSKTQPARLHMSVPNNLSRDFFLQDEEGNPLATIEGRKGFVTPRQPDVARNIRDFSGSSQERRKGHYRDLIESLLRHGFTLQSDSRNAMSNPFHRKFLRTLPDDIESPQEYQDLLGRYDDIEYEAHAPFSRTKDLDYGDLVVETRSKYPMTYDTPYQGYKRKLEEGIDPDQDIIVPAHIDREGNKIPQKRYLQSQLAGTGHEHDIGSVPKPITFTSDALITPEGIIVPRNLRSTSYYDPFMQTGGATIPEFQPDSEVLSASQPSAQKIMGFGIDPVSRMRQQIGVVDTGLPRPGSNEFGEKQLRRNQLDDKLKN